MGVSTFRAAAAAVIAAALALIAVAALAAPAEAAKPRAPKGFFGVHVRSLHGGDFARMRRADVGIVRTGFNLSTVRSSPLGPDNWSIFDNFVAGTANNGIDMLPVVYGIPSWLPGGLGSITDPLVKVAWRTYLTDLVGRYGPGGVFWKLHPEVKYRPIRYWQLWNEPNSFVNWKDPDGRDFGRFIADSADAIHAVDPDASIVSGGIVSEPLNPDVERGVSFLKNMLSLKAAKRAIDVVAVHPYAKNARSAKRAIKDTRKTMDRAGMKKAPIWITEIGWGSTTPPGSSGKVRGSRVAGAAAPRRWSMTPAKQRYYMRRTFEMALKQRLRLGLGRMIWYQWEDGPDSDCRWCETAGLLKQDGVAKQLLKVFKNLARM